MKYECGSAEEVNAIAGAKHIWRDHDRIVVFTGEDIPEDPTPMPFQAGLIKDVDDGSGDHEIMEAQEWLRARSEFGTLRFSPTQYPISDTVHLDAQRFSIDAQNARWVSTGFADEKPMLRLDNKLSLGDRFVGMTKISSLHLVGANDRDGKETGIYAHSDTVGASIRTLLDCVKVQKCGRGIALKSRAYFLRGIGVEVFRCRIGMHQEAGASDFAENVAFQLGTIFNCDCLLKDEGGQRWKFYGTSFDFFGDTTGYRVTPDDRLIDLSSGAEFELFGGHHEFHYGDHDGQTNSPIRLRGANTKFHMWGGKIYNGGSQNPLWPHLISTDNASQVVSLDGTQFVKMGRVGNATHDDQLVGGALANNTGVGSSVTLRNLRTVGIDKNDLPSVPSYSYGGQFLRNGVDDPHTELAPRITCTGAATISRASSENGVSPRNGTGSMIKIAGAGRVLISFPVYEPMRRHAWAMFFNTLTAVGTVSIKERHSTVVQKWDGASGIVVAPDTRNAYNNTTCTLVNGANEWRRVSWKDTVNNTLLVPRMNNVLFAIEIDTSGMTGGAVYLDDVAFGLM